MKADALISLASVLLFTGCASPGTRTSVDHSRSHHRDQAAAHTLTTGNSASAVKAYDMEIVELMDALIVVFGGNTTKTAVAKSVAPDATPTAAPVQAQLP